MLRLTFTSSSSSLLLACSRGGSTPTTTTSTTLTAVPLSSLCVSRRYQRSTSPRARSSAWEEKKKNFEDRQKEQQEEAARAARRRAQYASGASSSFSGAKTKKAAAGAQSSEVDAADAATSSPSSSSSSFGASLTKPAAGFWNFLRGGTKGRHTQPMNPLMLLQRASVKSAFDPDARAAQRLLDAVSGLRSRNARRKDAMTVQLPEEQKQEMVNRYVSTRWYAPLYRPFQSVTERQIRWSSRVAHFVLFLLVVGFIVVIFVAYSKEMETVAKLSPEDQADYAYMVRGMRYSDIYNAGQAVLEKDDPLEALPAEVRLRMVIDACRAKKWHQLDWDVELRKMHPRTPLQDRDYLHYCYWVMLEVGRAMVGGGAMFSDRILDYEKVQLGIDEPVASQSRFVELEPTELPANTKRGFFS